MRSVSVCSVFRDVDRSSAAGRPIGDVAPNGKTGLYSWPHDATLCVVARGAGYLVRVDDPLDWQLVVARPVIDVRPIPSRRIVVFANYTELIAYGASGVAWTTKRLGW